MQIIVDLFRRFSHWRLVRKARRAATPVGRCIACGGADLTDIADRVYRCGACGYEGGEGLAAHLAAAERAALDGEPTDALRARAARLLDDVVLQTGAAMGNDPEEAYWRASEARTMAHDELPKGDPDAKLIAEQDYARFMARARQDLVEIATILEVLDARDAGVAGAVAQLRVVAYAEKAEPVHRFATDLLRRVATWGRPQTD